MDNEKSQVAVAGLLQVFAVVVGFLTLGAVMKFNGYPEEIFIRWNPLARGLREHGAWLLMVPVTWCLATIVIWNYEKGELAFDFAIGFGYIFAVLLLLLFLCAIVNPFYRPLLFHFGH